MNEQTERIVRIISETVDLPPDRVGAGASMESLPEWDSLAQLTICMRVQEEFRIELDMDAIASATSVPALVALVRAR